MARSDNYVDITVEVKTVLPASVWVRYEGADGNIPRSTLHVSSDRALDAADRGDELTLRVREWKVDDLGWL